MSATDKELEKYMTMTRQAAITLTGHESGQTNKYMLYADDDTLEGLIERKLNVFLPLILKQPENNWIVGMRAYSILKSLPNFKEYVTPMPGNGWISEGMIAGKRFACMPRFLGDYAMVGLKVEEAA